MDRVGEEPGNTAIAPVVHVQFVRRGENAERKPFGEIPVAHHREALEQIDVGFLGGQMNEVDHAVDVMLGDDLRRILRVDQHHVGAGLAQLHEAVMERRGRLRQRAVAQHRVAADLPEHQVRLRRKHIAIEARQHVARFLAVDAAVDHGDRQRRKQLLQLDGKAAWIAHRG